MKRILLIYNPNSGNKTFKAELDTCITVFQQAGYLVHAFKSILETDIDQLFSNIEKDFYQAIAVAGGDGTLNLAINAFLKNDLNVPIGIIPVGTANDFATFLNIPKDVLEASAVIAKGHTIQSDVGEVNGRYFINVCAAGLFSNISRTVAPDFKNRLGKLAYYIKGLEQLPNFISFPVKIKTSKETMVEELYLFIILNSGGTGGFENLSINASIDDGKFDFIGIKDMQLLDMAKLVLKILKGEHLDDENVIYFQDEYIEIESLSDDDGYNYTDIDGEEGPSMPITVKNIKGRIQFFVP